MNDLYSEQWRLMRARIRHFLAFARKRIPAGVRSLVGLVLVALGVVGFLPIVGFWMIPLGLALIWVDVLQVLAMLGRSKTLSDQDDPTKQSQIPPKGKD